MKYIALLRGINISGKNKVPMNELKLELEKNKKNDKENELSEKLSKLSKEQQEALLKLLER